MSIRIICTWNYYTNPSYIIHRSTGYKTVNLLIAKLRNLFIHCLGIFNEFTQINLNLRDICRLVRTTHVLYGL